MIMLLTTHAMLCTPPEWQTEQCALYLRLHSYHASSPMSGRICFLWDIWLHLNITLIYGVNLHCIVAWFVSTENKHRENTLKEWKVYNKVLINTWLSYVPITLHKIIIIHPQLNATGWFQYTRHFTLHHIFSFRIPKTELKTNSLNINYAWAKVPVKGSLSPHTHHSGEKPIHLYIVTTYTHRLPLCLHTVKSHTAENMCQFDWQTSGKQHQHHNKVSAI